jgi:hypothetical protein
MDRPRSLKKKDPWPDPALSTVSAGLDQGDLRLRRAKTPYALSPRPVGRLPARAGLPDPLQDERQLTGLWQPSETTRSP